MLFRSNKLSFIESELIKELHSALFEIGIRNDGLVRRHDSILIFNPSGDTHSIENLEKIINSISFLDQKNWFSVKVKTIDKKNF